MGITVEQIYDQLSLLISAGMGHAELDAVTREGESIGSIKSIVGLEKISGKWQLHVSVNF